ncbi:MAG TPA: PQQ-binding-like beta-propeller repeat protein, partial [Chloroflexota bacterium]|nr:PQQ-binding-like beta-propeller repeat protein [Chloroflexota bacterium]
MHAMKRRGTWVRIAAALVLAGALSLSSAPHAMERAALAVSAATSVPPGAPAEDSRYAGEWPSPNGDLYNTRVAHTTISAANVAMLGIAWTLPLKSAGDTGYDVANPVLAAGIAYLQDGASNVMAVRYATGQVLWTHMYNSPDYGPNGVTIANGTIYGVTASGVFALDAKTGKQLWYDTHLAARKASFDIAPQVAGGKVFVSSALTVGGGIIYALDASTGATIWRFQTVSDKIGQQLPVPTGGAWDPFLIGPDRSVYAGIGNPYLSQQQALTTPSRELYTDSIVKLNQATGKLEWYYQAFPDDFHDWDLQISPIYTAAGHPVVLAAGKGGFVFAFDPMSGKLLWKTPVGSHNGHDQDGQLALEGKLHLKTPYTLLPGEAGGVETNMAAADGVVYVPVDNLPETVPSATAAVGTSNFAKATGEVVALSIATGKQLWATKLPQLPLGGAIVANDLVFTTTFTGGLVALSRKDGSIVWTAHLPAGANATLAIAGSTLFAGVGIPLTTTQHPMLVAYRLGAKGHIAPTPSGPAQSQAPGASRFLVGNAAAHTATLILVAGYNKANSGFNFDGASNGQAIVSIPVGYKVAVEFINAAALAHSAVVT